MVLIITGVAVTVLDGVLDPTGLTARTRKSYETVFVNPVTVALVVVPDTLVNVVHDVSLVNLYWTVYPVSADPPLEAGAVQLSPTCVLSGVTASDVGAPGTVAGVTGLDAEEALPVPTLLVAVTVKVYAVPLVRPVTVMGEELPVAVREPGEEVTV
jgi:hypothetical protein